MTVFNTIDYLQHGNARQREAYKVLCDNNIITNLEGYTPFLAGTIPINIDVENSDLDILCHYTNSGSFIKVLQKGFSHHSGFKISQKIINGVNTVLANFYCNEFEIEVFGQPVPVNQQAGYLHMIAEHQLLIKYGEAFRQEIISLKKSGYKTEPAFAKLLGLTGDPYTAILNYAID